MKGLSRFLCDNFHLKTDKMSRSILDLTGYLKSVHFPLKRYTQVKNQLTLVI
jgi:hypothetical protein